MKFSIAKKTRKLNLLRWDKIKQSPAIWILFVLCLAVSFCTNAFVDDDSRASVVKALIVVCNNICYGYIAGFVFYVLSQFLPDTKKEIEADLRILVSLEYILNTMTFFEKEVLGDRYKEGKTDDIILASFMIKESAARVHFEEDENIFTLTEEVQALMDVCRRNMQDYMQQLLTQDSSWLDDYASILLISLDSFFSVKNSAKEGSLRRISAVCLKKNCKDFYLVKSCLEKYKEELMKYYFLDDNNSKL